MMNSINNVENMHFPSKWEDSLKNLMFTFSKIAFKYNILDSQREEVFAAFADACVAYACGGGDIKEAVEVLFAGRYISSKRDSDIFYKECVNRLMFTGSKLSKYSLFHCLDTLQKTNELNTILIKAQNSIEDNISDDLKVTVTPTCGYSQVTITFEDKDGPSGKMLVLDETDTPLKLLQKIYSQAATFHKEYGYEKKYGINLEAILDAELVHKVFIETERMTSSEKVTTLKTIFKDASPELKERFCNLYLGDYSKELRQFLNEETMKMVEEKNIAVRPGNTLKRQTDINM